MEIVTLFAEIATVLFTFGLFIIISYGAFRALCFLFFDWLEFDDFTLFTLAIIAFSIAIGAGVMSGIFYLLTLIVPIYYFYYSNLILIYSLPH